MNRRTINKSLTDKEIEILKLIGFQEMLFSNYRNFDEFTINPLDFNDPLTTILITLRERYPLSDFHQDLLDATDNLGSPIRSITDRHDELGIGLEDGSVELIQVYDLTRDAVFSLADPKFFTKFYGYLDRWYKKKYKWPVFKGT